jgi:hypothetical protein
MRTVDRLPGRRDAVVVGGVSAVYLLVTLLENALRSAFQFPLLSVLELTTALPLPLVLVLGPTSLVGVPVGYVLSDVASSAVGPGTLVGVCAHLYLGYSAGAVARRVDVGSAVPSPTTTGMDALARYLLVAGVSAAGAAAVFGWGNEVVQTTPFFVATPLSFGEFLVLNLLVGLPVVGLFRRVAVGALPVGRPDPGTGGSGGELELLGVVLATATWVIGGVVWSLGYRTVPGFPQGPLAARVQVVFGAVLLSVILALLAGSRSRRGNGVL